MPRQGTGSMSGMLDGFWGLVGDPKNRVHGRSSSCASSRVVDQPDKDRAMNQPLTLKSALILLFTLFGVGLTAISYFYSLSREDFQEVKAEIKGVRAELKAEIKGVKTELKAEIQGVKTELKADIKDLALKVEKNGEDIRALKLKVTVIEGKFDRVLGRN